MRVRRKTDNKRNIQRLFMRPMSAVQLGLDCTRGLLEQLGRPQDQWLGVHVAGTNGKGSVAAMTESVLRSMGLRVALYTSPHLVRFHERVMVAGQPIRDDDLAALFLEVEQAESQWMTRTGGRAATFFEFTTVMAFLHFARCGVQVAVVETGLGGRLDATNVIVPLVSVITPIGIEHRHFLGDTLPAIAAEKAGIIKPNRPVVVAAMDADAEAVLCAVARERGAPLTRVSETVRVCRLAQTDEGQKIRVESESADYPPVMLPLVGDFQVDNAATAVAALEGIARELGVELAPAVLKKGLEAVRWPGRLQCLAHDPLTWLDVAHNPAAAEALAASLRTLAGRKPVALVVGMLSDKDAYGFFKALAACTGHAWLLPLSGERAMPLMDLMRAAQRAGVSATQAIDLRTARAAAEAWARQHNGVVVLAGSLVLAGMALAESNLE